MKGTVLGVKFTHDGGVAMIRDGQLMFSVEMEKLHNNSRYSKITKADQIIEVLAMFGVNPTEIDIVAVDGWKGGMIKTPFHKDNVEVAGYHEFDQPFGSLQIPKLLDWRIPGLRCPHVSYTHITGHIVGSYVSSVMSMVEQPAAVITFDGGQNARAHMVDPGSDDPVRFLGTVHRLHGILYGIMRYYFGPYRDPEVAALDYNFKEHGPRYGDGYEFPGKLMSYIALGKPDIRLLNLLHDFYRTIDWGEDYNELGMNQTGEVEHRLMKYAGLHARDLKDPDVLHTIHAFLEELIVTGAKKVIPRGTPLIFTGGSALNI
jgi:carbamoyltransferase